jgi:hypothetical protein
MQVPTLKNPNNPPKKGQKPFIAGYSDWLKELPSGLSKDEQDQFLFMIAATWADSIKHEWLHDSDTPPAGLKKEVNIGFSDKDSHGYWHFVDAGFASDTSTVPKTPTPDAATQIAALRTAVASGEPGLLEAYDLVWLEHLVGDIHQPLHGVARFDNGKSDLGGNLVKIKIPPDMEKLFGGPKSSPRDLHAFWDDLPGVGEPDVALNPAATFAGTLTIPAQTSKLVADIDPSDWAEESFTLAKKDGYAMPPLGHGLIQDNGQPYQIPQSYYDASLKDAQTRIALAGARLAKLLRENLQ